MHTLKKAYLEITNVCNLSCNFCPGTKRAQGFLSPKNFEVLASRLRPHTEYLYLHLMGEPLIHPQLEEILSLAGQLEFHVVVTTNGTQLEEKKKILLNSQAVDKISISVHSFEGNENQGDLHPYLNQCIIFAKEASQAKKRCAFRLWNLDSADIKGANQYNDTILSVFEQAFPSPWKEGRRGTTLSPNIFLEWGEKFQWPDLNAPEEEGRRFCYGLRDQIGVLWNGIVVPCCLDHEGDIPLGNLYEQSLEDIINSPRAKAIYNGFSHGQANEELCRRCGFIRRFQ